MKKLLLATLLLAITGFSQTTSDLAFDALGVWLPCASLPVQMQGPLCAASPSARPYLLTVRSEIYGSVGFSYQITGTRSDGSVETSAGFFARNDNPSGYTQTVIQVDGLTSIKLTVSELTPGVTHTLSK
jgi:hypothetical protein